MAEALAVLVEVQERSFEPDSIKFYTRTKTVTARWPSGIKEGGEFNFKAMD